MITIGYVPMTADLSAPGDRRRFCAYARSRNLNFEVAVPGRVYDLVVVSPAGDIVAWSKPGRRCGKLIYDLPDSYLALPFNVKDVIRGVGKYVLRELSAPVISYKQAVARMCSSADAVVCTTEEQQRQIAEFSPNVHPILDVNDIAVREIKSDYLVGDTLNLFWEGLPYTLAEFAALRNVLKELSSEQPVVVHVMTQLRFARWSRQVGVVHTKNVAARLFDRAYVYEWNELMLSRIGTGCDLGVIPLDLSNPFARGKPENKLLLMWRMGLPTLAAATPAYTRAMRGADLDMTCETNRDWLEKLRAYAADEDARRLAAQRGRAYAEREFSRERIVERWDAVFESIGCSPGS